MKTLDEHNEEQRRFIDGLKAKPKGAGVACGICRKEMVLSSENTLLSMPPIMKVHCLSGCSQGLMII